MWEGSYGREPFDLRLTTLRLLRSLHKILAVVLIGTILFGGGYYVKNVILAEKLYTTTITCKVEYTNPPVKSGDYYINFATWNTYVDSREFLDMMMAAEPLASADSYSPDAEEIKEAVTADVPSDIQVPTFTITSDTEEHVDILARTVEQVVTGPWTERLPEVASIDVIDVEPVHLYVDEFLRPARAFVFGAVVTGFFALVLFLLREIGADSIWLPATLRTRYGLTAMGTTESGELKENMRYAFAKNNGKMQRVAVCPADDGIDPGEVLGALRRRGVLDLAGDWIPMPAPVLSPESARELREADGVLLVVPAGLHTGKPLEHTLEFFREQDIKITGAILWDADEKLIGTYYRLRGC